MFAHETDIKKIGVLGGTFNPPHNAHIDMARLAQDMFSLERVFFMVSGDPPHKQVADNTPAITRLAMAALAVEPYPAFIASDIEILRGGKSYMFDTVEHLKRLYVNAEIYLIIGGDMLRELHTWHCADQLLHGAVLIAFSNRNENAEIDADRLCTQYNADIRLIDHALPHISSTAIRARVYQAQPTFALIPDAVERFIYEEGLYFPDDFKALLNLCKEKLKPRRFRHTMGVVRTAIALSDRYHVNAEKTRLAALLHDYGRSIEWDALRHAPLGAKLAKEELHIDDQDVLQAIRLHTTLSKHATKLDKLIYLADMIEPNRDIPGLARLRALAEIDLDAAAYMALKRTAAYLSEIHLPMEQNALDAQAALYALCEQKGLLSLIRDEN